MAIYSFLVVAFLLAQTGLTTQSDTYSSGGDITSPPAIVNSSSHSVVPPSVQVAVVNKPASSPPTVTPPAKPNSVGTIVSPSQHVIPPTKPPVPHESYITSSNNTLPNPQGTLVSPTSHQSTALSDLPINKHVTTPSTFASNAVPSTNSKVNPTLVDAGHVVPASNVPPIIPNGNGATFSQVPQRGWGPMGGGGCASCSACFSCQGHMLDAMGGGMYESTESFSQTTSEMTSGF